MKKYTKVVLYVCVSVIVLAAVGVFVEEFVELYSLKTINVDIKRAMVASVCAALVGGFIFVKRHGLD